MLAAAARACLPRKKRSCFLCVHLTPCNSLLPCRSSPGSCLGLSFGPVMAKALIACGRKGMKGSRSTASPASVQPLPHRCPAPLSRSRLGTAGHIFWLTATRSACGVPGCTIVLGACLQHHTTGTTLTGRLGARRHSVRMQLLVSGKPHWLARAPSWLPSAQACGRRCLPVS